MSTLSEITFGGLEGLLVEEKIPLTSAIEAMDCYVEGDSVFGRNGYVNPLTARVSSGGESPQLLSRFRPNSTSARTVTVAGGRLWRNTDPSSDTASDGVATEVLLSGLAPFGSSDTVSGVQLGKYHYFANNNSTPTWCRMKPDFTLENIVSLAKGTKPSTSTSALSFTKFTSLSAPTLAGGASNTTIFTDWVKIDNGGGAKCPIGGNITYDLGADKDWSGMNWLAIAAAAPTNSKGGSGGILSIAIATSGGTFEEIGTMYDTPGGGSVNYAFYNVNALSSGTRSAVRKIRITLTKAADYWAVHGFMPIPGAPGYGDQIYNVDFYNTSTQQVSDLTDDLTVTYTYDGISIPTYHSVYSDSTNFIDGGNSSLDPDGANRNRCFNIGGGLALPSKYEFAQVVTFSGSIPTGSLYPLADTVRLWRITSAGRRLVKSLTLSSGATTTYALTDDQGSKTLANQTYHPKGPPPKATAMTSYSGRLICSNENRIYVSDYVPFGQDTDPFPQFTINPEKSADGWSFDLSESNAEQVVSLVKGDALYMLTNENAFLMNDISPGMDPYKIVKRGCVGRDASIWAEDRIMWVAYDGIYWASRSRWEELGKRTRRLVRSWLQPTSTCQIAYQNRKLYVIQDTRFLRYDFVEDKWTRGTLSHTISKTCSWTEFGGALAGRNELLLLTSTLYQGRWTSSATTDLGTSIPDWSYSTGYNREGIKFTVDSLLVDTTGTLTITLYNSSEASQSRWMSVEPGEGQYPGWVDFANVKGRLLFQGANTTRLRSAWWSLGGLDTDGNSTVK